MTQGLNQLEARFAEFVRAREALSKVVSEAQPGWERVYFDGRVRISQEIADIAHQANEIAATSKNEKHIAFARAAENFARSAKAHQQSWPIILIKKKPEEFFASIASLAEEVKQLSHLLRTLD